MHTRLRLAGALLAAVAATSCSRGGLFGDCLHPDCRPVDSIYANVWLCGFPFSQLDRSGEFSRSVVHLGQRIPLQLTGRLELVRTIEWSAEPRFPSARPRAALLTPTSRTTAVLEGIAPSGDGPGEDLSVGARLTFEDGTEGWAPVAFCRGQDRLPADHIVVRP